jgi:hypothetical protein
MYMGRFNLKKLNEGEVKEQYQVTIKNRFSALENVEDNGDINKARDAINVTHVTVYKNFCQREYRSL